MQRIKQLPPSMPGWLRAASAAGAMSLAALLTGCASSPALVADPDQKALVDFTSCAKPAWNQADLDAGHEGTVHLRFLVSSKGEIEDSAIARSSGYPGMDQAAQAGILKCRFKPALKDGKPVRTWAALQYVWTQH